MEGRHGRPLRKRIGNYRNYGGERWVSKHLWRESSTIPRRRPTETFTGLPTCSTRVKAPSSNGCGILWSAKSRRSSMIIGARDKFPFEVIPKLAALGIGGVGYQGYGSAGGSMLLNGFISMELARVDASIATFWGVHTGL